MDFQNLDASIHRSLKRWVADAMGGSPWQVKMSRKEVAEAKRPSALVEPTTPTNTIGRASTPSGAIEVVCGWAVMLYPDTGGDGTAAEALDIANKAKGALTAAIVIGMVDEDGNNVCNPLHIPLYDYTNVPISGAQRAGPPSPILQMSITDHAVRMIPDADDDRRNVVAADLTLRLRVGGRIEAEGLTAASMTAEIEVST